MVKILRKLKDIIRLSGKIGVKSRQVFAADSSWFKFRVDLRRLFLQETLLVSIFLVISVATWSLQLAQFVLIFYAVFIVNLYLKRIIRKLKRMKKKVAKSAKKIRKTKRYVKVPLPF